MKNQIHGHEVMRMMLESDKEYTKETLYEAIVEKFGEDSKFYACSADTMSPKEVIEFLESKGKFIDKGKGFNTAKDNICSHE